LGLGGRGVALDHGAADGGVKDFILLDKKALESMKVAEEVVETPAGTTKATHYKKKKGLEVLDFWVSDEAKPIKLVKLVSSGKQKFALSLSSLVKNTQPKIDRKKVVPLSEKGKALLSISGGGGFLP